MVSISKIHSSPSFSSWDQVISVAKKKNVRCFETSSDQLVVDLELIQTIAHRRFFKESEFDLLHSWLNGINSFDGSEFLKNIHYGFVHDLHRLANQIAELNNIPGNKKLMQAGIFSNFGLYTQFLIVLCLNKHLKIVDQELFVCGKSGMKVDIDVQISLEGKTINVQVKDVREHSRQDRQEEAIMIIDAVLASRARELQLDETLALKSFKGIPPNRINQIYWDRYAHALPYEAGKHLITFPPKEGKNLEPLDIEMEFEFRPFSGIFDHSARGFNNTPRLEYEYNKLNDSVVTSKDEVFLLIAVSDDKYEWNELLEGIKTEKIGLLVVDIGGNEIIQRSPFMLPKQDESLQTTLNRIVPEWFEL